MKFSLDIGKIDLNKAKSDVKDKAKLILYRTIVKMEELAKYNAPVGVSGDLRNRIHIIPDQPGFERYVLSDGVEYGIHVEYGTKPHFVPIAPLKLWAKRVLGDEGAAYAVRHKIAEKGTTEQPFFRPAIHEVQYKWLPVIKERVLAGK